jgi:hypothetical protein
MSDQWEGSLTKIAKEIYRQQFSTYKNTANASAATLKYEDHRNLFYINCWHMNDHESYLIWKAYGNKQWQYKLPMKGLFPPLVMSHQVGLSLVIVMHIMFPVVFFHNNVRFVLIYGKLEDFIAIFALKEMSISAIGQTILS